MVVRGRERVKFKSMRDGLLLSHIFFIFNPITCIDFHDCAKELFYDCSSATDTIHSLYMGLCTRIY